MPTDSGPICIEQEQNQKGFILVEKHSHPEDGSIAPETNSTPGKQTWKQRIAKMTESPQWKHFCLSSQYREANINAAVAIARKLLLVLKERKTITYSDLLCGIEFYPSGSSQLCVIPPPSLWDDLLHARIVLFLNESLGVLSMITYAEADFMISAVVVYSDKDLKNPGKPNEEFYKSAFRLGALKSQGNRKKFWSDQCNKAWDAAAGAGKPRPSSP